MNGAGRPMTEQSSLIYYAAEEPTDPAAFVNQVRCPIGRDVCAVSGNLNPVLRLVLLPICVGEFANEKLFIRSFCPGLGNLGANRARRPANLVCKRISLLFRK